MRKQLERWYSRLTRVGKILLVAAAIALIWLLFQLINSIFGFMPRMSELIGIFALIINLVCILLIVFVVAQAAAIVYMMNEESELYREMMTRGRRGGNQMEQIGGRRHAGSMTRRGSRNMQVAMSGHLTVDNINQKYPARWYKRATPVQDWMDIEEPGVYVLAADNKQKVEIIDANEVGGGYILGTWDGRFIQWKRNLVLNKKTGRPQTYTSLRNAKKQISKLP